MYMKRCFLIGPRLVSGRARWSVREAVERHITEYGVREFIVGSYGGFAAIATGVLLEAKKMYPNILLYMLVPYTPEIRPVELPDGFEGTCCPDGMEGVPVRRAMARADRYMVDSVDYLITCVRKTGDNVRLILKYAQKREKQGLLHIEDLE